MTNFYLKDKYRKFYPIEREFDEEEDAKYLIGQKLGEKFIWALDNNNMNDLFAKLPENDTAIEDEYYRRYTLQNFLEMVEDCPIKEIDQELNWN